MMPETNAQEPLNQEPIADNAATDTETAFEPEVTQLEEVVTEPETRADTLANQLAEEKDKYIRLYSEFDNFRRRTSREKIDLISQGNASLLLKILPAVDDFARALEVYEQNQNQEMLKEGIKLVHQKLTQSLTSAGLKPMEAKGLAFNTEEHEAITQIPAPTDDLKGKVLDEVTKGYYLGDKVLRHAKVVIGS